MTDRDHFRADLAALSDAALVERCVSAITLDRVERTQGSRDVRNACWLACCDRPNGDGLWAAALAAVREQERAVRAGNRQALAEFVGRLEGRGIVEEGRS